MKGLPAIADDPQGVHPSATGIVLSVRPAKSSLYASQNLTLSGRRCAWPEWFQRYDTDPGLGGRSPVRGYPPNMIRPFRGEGLNANANPFGWLDARLGALVLPPPFWPEPRGSSLPGAARSLSSLPTPLIAPGTQV